MLAALAALVAGSPSIDAIERPSAAVVLARASTAAVRGRVAALASTQDPDTGAIYTLVTIDVARAWGFPTAPAHVEVRVLGGVHGTTALVIGEQARFTPGEDVFVLLEVRPRDGSFAVTGLEHGKWSLAPGDAEADFEALAALTGTAVRLPADWRPVQGIPGPAGLDAATDLDAVSTGRWHEADWSAPVPVDSAPEGHLLFPGGGFAQVAARHRDVVCRQCAASRARPVAHAAMLRQRRGRRLHLDRLRRSLRRDPEHQPDAGDRRRLPGPAGSPRRAGRVVRPLHQRDDRAR